MTLAILEFICFDFIKLSAINKTNIDKSNTKSNLLTSVELKSEDVWFNFSRTRTIKNIERSLTYH